MKGSCRNDAKEFYRTNLEFDVRRMASTYALRWAVRRTGNGERRTAQQ